MITPRENYLMMLRGEIPEYVPAPALEQSIVNLHGELGFGSPIYATDGPLYSPWGVKFVGSADSYYGAIPEPNNFILRDIRKWRDVIKNPDMSGFDWESKIKKTAEGKDPDKLLMIGGSDYFQTLISFMGFEEGLIAMHEEPEEVFALLDYVSEYYLEVLRQVIRHARPQVHMIADDCAAQRTPFFSPEMYRSLIKPFHKRQADIALENGLLLERHDCGRSEVFIDDWLDIGIRCWNPAQTTNDLKAIKTKYLGKLAINGGWDNQGPISRPEVSDEALTEALYEYVDTLAPGGGFCFMAMCSGDREDERVKHKNELIRKFYEDYVRDYYKNH